MNTSVEKVSFQPGFLDVSDFMSEVVDHVDFMGEGVDLTYFASGVKNDAANLWIFKG